METKEQTIPIDQFRGVDANSDSEKSTPQHLKKAQNLWERRLGVLETRGHSQDFVNPASLPANLNKLMSGYKLYKSSTETVRMVAAEFEPDVAEGSTPLPAGVSVRFTNFNSHDLWGKDFSIGGTTYSRTPHMVVLRFVGYGYSKYYEVDPTTLTGWTTGGASLTVAVSQALALPITGIEIYARMKVGTVGGGAFTELWAGFMDVSNGYTGTQYFGACPVGLHASMALPITFGDTKRTFAATTTVWTDPTDLVPGKTYCVLVAPQYCRFTADSNADSYYRQPSVGLNSSDIVKVTIPDVPGVNYAISLTHNIISPLTASAVIFVGDSPQTLQPVAVANPTTTTYTFITKLPKGNPGLAQISHTQVSPQLSSVWFDFSSYSVRDTLIRVEDDGKIYPIFYSRLATVREQRDLATLIQTTELPILSTYHTYLRTAVVNNEGFHVMGEGDVCRFTTYQNLCFFVNTHDPSKYSATGYYNASLFRRRTWSNYSITDGMIAGPVIEEAQGVGVGFYHGLQYSLPSFKYINYYDGSIILSGGEPSIDRVHELANNISLGIDARMHVYFSRALNPYNLTIAGAASTTHQMFRVQQRGEAEAINGLGIFNINTSNEGPSARLAISKRNSMYLMDGLPTVTSSTTSINASLVPMAGKLGAVSQECMVLTPIGFIFVSYDNVYLMSSGGEPAPIGQELADILKRSDLTKAVATIHDRHMKLSFNDPKESVSAFNNVEYWLNINKQVEGKGQADWVGPMLGRSIQHTWVEDQQPDGLSYQDASKRFAIDAGNKRIFLADVKPLDTDEQILDFTTPVTSALESKDFGTSEQDTNWNKLLKRLYWKLRCNKAQGSPLSFTQKIWIDGVLVETQMVTHFGLTGTSFGDQPLKLNRVFPTGRRRGRTIRIAIETTHRIACGGYLIGYEVERRRI